MTTIPTIGFITPPLWFEPALTEFPTVVEEQVRIQQAPLLLPNFDYSLKSIASVQEHLNLCARSLKAMECQLIAQIGSPFSWAGTNSESEAEERCLIMQREANIPCIMTGLTIVNGLRTLGVKNIAVNCTYYDADWRDNFAAFLRNCNFNLLHVSNLAEQRLTEADAKMEDYGWSMTDELTCKSILKVASASPDAEAIVVTGTGTRTLSILAEMESEIKRPIIAADTILYWAIARHFGLTLKSSLGSLATL